MKKKQKHVVTSLSNKDGTRPVVLGLRTVYTKQFWTRQGLFWSYLVLYQFQGKGAVSQGAKLRSATCINRIFTLKRQLLYVPGMTISALVAPKTPTKQSRPGTRYIIRLNTTTKKKSSCINRYSNTRYLLLLYQVDDTWYRYYINTALLYYYKVILYCRAAPTICVALLFLNVLLNCEGWTLVRGHHGNIRDMFTIRYEH